MGSEWSMQTCQLHITPGFQTFSSGKVSYYGGLIKILGVRGLSNPTCKG